MTFGYRIGMAMNGDWIVCEDGFQKHEGFREMELFYQSHEQDFHRIVVRLHADGSLEVGRKESPYVCVFKYAP